MSDKLSEEITLTIGQAFDLAYKRFLETSGKDLEAQRRTMILKQKIKRLEHENNIYRQRLQDIAAIKGSVCTYHCIRNIVILNLKNFLEIGVLNRVMEPNVDQYFFSSINIKIIFYISAPNGPSYILH